MVNRNARVIDRAIELFGFFLAQEFASNPLTPKLTGHMRSTFPGTLEIVDGPNGKIIRFTTPYYTEYVNDGTERIRARHFIQKIIHQKGQELLKKAFRVASKQIQ